MGLCFVVVWGGGWELHDENSVGLGLGFEWGRAKELFCVWGLLGLFGLFWGCVGCVLVGFFWGVVFVLGVVGFLRFGVGGWVVCFGWGLWVFGVFALWGLCFFFGFGFFWLCCWVFFVFVWVGFVGFVLWFWVCALFLACIGEFVPSDINLSVASLIVSISVLLLYRLISCFCQIALLHHHEPHS